MKELLHDILDMALASGATGARARIDCGFEDAVTVLDGAVDKVETSEGKVLVLKLFRDGRMGVFSTNQFEREQLREFVSHASEMTSLMEQDECNVMPDPALYYRPGDDDPDLKQYDSRIEDITAVELREMAMECCAGVKRVKCGNLLSAETEAGRSVTHSYLADTGGFYGAEDSSMVSISAQCSVQDEDGSRPEGFWFDLSAGDRALDCAACGETAIRRTLERMGASKVDAGVYDIVVDTESAAKFVSPIISSLSGSAIYNKNSFLLDSLGKRKFATSLNILETPHIVGAMGSSYFDSEGLATKTGPIIEDGYVRKYFLSSYYARKLGMTATGGSPAVMEIKGSGTRDELLAKVGRGLLITSFLGGNHNTSTGDFSYGINCFLFENGRIVRPVDGMNVTGNFLDIWGRQVLAADDCRCLSGRRIPSLAFTGVSIS